MPTAANHLNAAAHPPSGYEEILAPLDPAELREECLRRDEDHAGACRLAFELYLAGTEETNETFRGPKDDPVADVRAHVARVRADLAEAQADREAMAGRLRQPLERSDAAGKSPADLALAGVSIRDAVRARLADAVKLGNQHPKDEVYAWLVAAYSDCLELASLLVPPADPAP